MILSYFQIDMVIGEPNFSASMLPWHNLLFWFTLEQLHLTEDHSYNNYSKNRIAAAEKPVGLSSKFVFPKSAKLWIAPVHYHHLWKIRAPLHNVEGFDMEHFDTKIMVRAVH